MNDDKRAQRRTVLAIVAIAAIVILLDLFQLLPGSVEHRRKQLRERLEKSAPANLTEPDSMVGLE